MSFELDSHIVYLYSTPDGTPVYAGCTSSLKRRKSQHKDSSRWWAPDLQITFTVHPSIEGALRAEAILINDLKPYGNKHIPRDPRVLSPAQIDAKAQAHFQMRLYPIAEAAEYLGITPDEVSTLIRTRRIGHLDLNRGTDEEPMLRIPARSLTRYQNLLAA